MKDPVGWAGKDGSISSEIEALFESARPARSMTQAQRLRMNHAVHSIATTPITPWPMMVAKNVIVAAMGVTMTGVLVNGESDKQWALSIDHARTPETVVTSEIEAIRPIEREKPMRERDDARAASPEHPPVAPVVPRGPGKPATHGTVAEKAATPPTEEPLPVQPPEKQRAEQTDTDTLELEIESLEKARQTLARNPGATLEQLDEHRRNFSSGRLSLGREVLAIDALLKLGRKGEARTRAETLLANAAGTPYEARVQKQLDEAK